jgi:hypothetical protein
MLVYLSYTVSTLQKDTGHTSAGKHRLQYLHRHTKTTAAIVSPLGEEKTPLTSVHPCRTTKAALVSPLGEEKDSCDYCTVYTPAGRNRLQ